MFNFFHRITPIIWGLFALSAVILSTQLLDDIDNASTELISPPPMLEHYVFGHHEITADVMWIRAIQDLDYCENLIAKNLCQGNSWLSKMLDTMTTLSPHFYAPYTIGGIALSVLISDIEGATKLFDKGEPLFPDRWPFLYRGAYHAIYEEKDMEKAARRLEKAAKAGAPEWMYALSARMYTEAGRQELGKRLLEQLESNPNTDPKIIERMRERLSQN